MLNEKETPGEGSFSSGVKNRTSTKDHSTHPDEQSQPLPLQSRHLEDLKKSGLSDETIRAAGLRSVTEAEARQLLRSRTRVHWFFQRLG